MSSSDGTGYSSDENTEVRFLGPVRPRPWKKQRSATVQPVTADKPADKPQADAVAAEAATKPKLVPKRPAEPPFMTTVLKSCMKNTKSAHDYLNQMLQQMVRTDRDMPDLNQIRQTKLYLDNAVRNLDYVIKNAECIPVASEFKRIHMMTS